MTPTTIDSPKNDFRRIFLILGTCVITIYGLLVVLGVVYFRSEIRHQILQRDGIHLTSIANFLNNRDSGTETREWSILPLAIDTIDIDGIIAVRVFDESGRYMRGIPSTLFPAAISTEDQRQLDAGMPVIRFYPEYPLYRLFNDFESVVVDTAPLIEVLSPLKHSGTGPLGSIQFWSDGSSIAEEFRTLDQKLAITGILLVTSGGFIFLILFMYARHRLFRLANLLADRNRSLEMANAELAMSARTSAIGSIASHLFHGLKNPLAGLKAYLRVTADDQEAVAIADRMQALIDESLSVIREQDIDSHTSMSVPELHAEIEHRFRDLTSANNTHLVVTASGDGVLDTRKARLLLLILRNLAENAFDASPEGGTVQIVLNGSGAALDIEVSDSGSGLPGSVKERLFEPVHSSKSGGTGIGLAISSVIARHIPANLSLKSSGPEGTTFLISLPY